MQLVVSQAVMNETDCSARGQHLRLHGIKYPDEVVKIYCFVLGDLTNNVEALSSLGDLLQSTCCT